MDAPPRLAACADRASTPNPDASSVMSAATQSAVGRETRYPANNTSAATTPPTNTTPRIRSAWRSFRSGVNLERWRRRRTTPQPRSDRRATAAITDPRSMSQPPCHLLNWSRRFQSRANARLPRV